MTVKLLNSVLNYAKVGLILTTDLVNKLWDPFETFDRPIEEKYPEPLHVKERKFDDLMSTFYWPEKNIYLYKLPHDAGDQCIWHGIYTAMWALKTSVTNDHYSQLFGCLEGLRSFLLGGKLIRGWTRDGVPELNVSNDQASGFLAGAYFGWKYGDINCRIVAKDLIVALADELAIHDNKLVNPDGIPTKHGKLENGYLTDPLNLGICLVIYKVAHAVTGEQLYDIRYRALVEKYRPMIPYARVKLLWRNNSYDAHRAAISYSILCDLEKDHDLNRLYLKGLLRTWVMERKSGNPWIYFLLRRVCLFDPSHIDACRKHLKEFTLEDKYDASQRINSDKVDTFKWGKHYRTRQPLPRWRVGSQDFFWQRNLYSADDWQGYAPGDLRHNGGDFLIAYWGLRSLRLLGADE